MKKCPFCAEEIQDEAVKCRHCSESLVNAPRRPIRIKRLVIILIGGSVILAGLAMGGTHFYEKWRYERWVESHKEAMKEEERSPTRFRSSILQAVHLGMDTIDVADILGQPDDTQASTSRSGETLYWYYNTADGKVQLVFEDTVLRSKNAY